MGGPERKPALVTGGNSGRLATAGAAAQRRYHPLISSQAGPLAMGMPAKALTPKSAKEARPTLCDRSLASLRLTGFLARFDAVHMPGAPFAEGFQRRIKRVAERRKCVLDARRNFLEIPPLNNAIRLHFLEMLDQHLLADPLNRTAQFSEAARLRSQRPQNQHFPFPADHRKRRLQAAAVGLVSHHKCSRFVGFHTYPQVSTCPVEIKIDIRQAAKRIGG